MIQLYEMSPELEYNFLLLKVISDRKVISLSCGVNHTVVVTNYGEVFIS